MLVLAILDPALLAAVKDQPNTATVVTKHTSCAAPIPTSPSRLESRATKSVASFWDVVNTAALLFVTQVFALPAVKNRCKSATVVNMNGRRAVETEKPGPPLLTGSSKQDTTNAAIFAKGKKDSL